MDCKGNDTGLLLPFLEMMRLLEAALNRLCRDASVGDSLGAFLMLLNSFFKCEGGMIGGLLLLPSKTQGSVYLQ